MLSVAFLKDILAYLNLLNSELKGHKILICDLISLCGGECLPRTT